MAWIPSSMTMTRARAGDDSLMESKIQMIFELWQSLASFSCIESSSLWNMFSLASGRDHSARKMWTANQEVSMFVKWPHQPHFGLGTRIVTKWANKQGLWSSSSIVLDPLHINFTLWPHDRAKGAWGVGTWRNEVQSMVEGADEVYALFSPNTYLCWMLYA